VRLRSSLRTAGTARSRCVAAFAINHATPTEIAVTVSIATGRVAERKRDDGSIVRFYIAEGERIAWLQIVSDSGDTLEIDPNLAGIMQTVVLLGLMERAA
jgi:hypothetical protein